VASAYFCLGCGDPAGAGGKKDFAISVQVF
jgi:hypothetical protein